MLHNCYGGNQNKSKVLVISYYTLGLIPGRETAVCRYLAADDENNLSEWTLNLVLRLWGKNVSNTSVLSFWLKEEVDIQHLTTDFEKFLWFRHRYSRDIINKFSFVYIMYQSNIIRSHNEYEVYIVFYVKYLFWRFVVHLWNLVWKCSVNIRWVSIWSSRLTVSS